MYLGKSPATRETPNVVPETMKALKSLNQYLCGCGFRVKQEVSRNAQEAGSVAGRLFEMNLEL